MLKRCKHLSKTAPRAEGPFRVVRVSGQYGQRITIARHLEKRPRTLAEPHTTTVHASQLIPYSPALAEPMYIEFDPERNMDEQLHQEETAPELEHLPPPKKTRQHK